jgi:uncharacterized protein
MTFVFVDTGAWFASFIPTDPDHAAASRWLAGNRDRLVTTDYIVDETLTLLRARKERASALAAAAVFFRGELAAIHFLSEADLRAASDVFCRFSDKEWSFTDCTSKVVIERLGLTMAFAFDDHFRQFGSVTIVP